MRTQAQAADQTSTYNEEMQKCAALAAQRNTMQCRLKLYSFVSSRSFAMMRDASCLLPGRLVTNYALSRLVSSSLV